MSTESAEPESSPLRRVLFLGLLALGIAAIVFLSVLVVSVLTDATEEVLDVQPVIVDPEEMATTTEHLVAIGAELDEVRVDGVGPMPATRISECANNSGFATQPDIRKRWIVERSNDLDVLPRFAEGLKKAGWTVEVSQPPDFSYKVSTERAQFAAYGFLAEGRDAKGRPTVDLIVSIRDAEPCRLG